MRWRWPRIGREGGLGGWCLCFVLVWSKNLNATARRRRRRERDENGNMSSMFDLLFVVMMLCDNLLEDYIWVNVFYKRTPSLKRTPSWE